MMLDPTIPGGGGGDDQVPHPSERYNEYQEFDHGHEYKPV